MEKPGLLHVIKSVIGAFIGVQSGKNREKDFEQGSLSNYIIVGVIAVVLFISLLVFIVSIVTG